MCFPYDKDEDASNHSTFIDSEVSKSDSATANIPSSIDILEENVTKNPEFCITTCQRCPHESKLANVPPVREAIDAAPATHLLESSEEATPRLNEARLILIIFPPTVMEMRLLKSQGTGIVGRSIYASKSTK
jgi:hypothetical protein